MNPETSFQSSDQGRVKLVVDPEVRRVLSVHPPEMGTGLWLSPAFLLMCLVSSPNFLFHLALSFAVQFLSLALSDLLHLRICDLLTLDDQQKYFMLEA